jgi:hypothetical protein
VPAFFLIHVDVTHVMPPGIVIVTCKREVAVGKTRYRSNGPFSTEDFLR